MLACPRCPTGWEFRNLQADLQSSHAAEKQPEGKLTKQTWQIYALGWSCGSANEPHNCQLDPLQFHNPL